MCAISKVVPAGFWTPRMSEHNRTLWFLGEERGLEVKPLSVGRRERTERSRGRNSVVASQAAFTSARLFVSVYRCVCDWGDQKRREAVWSSNCFCVGVCYRFRVCSAGCDDLWSWDSVYCVLLWAEGERGTWGLICDWGKEGVRLWITVV